MNLDRLYEILNATTQQVRVGESDSTVEKEGLVVRTLDINPTEGEIKKVVDERKLNVKYVDCVLVKIAVVIDEAEKYRAEFIELMKTYPNQDQLRAGPSYIHIGAEIGDQGMAFCLMALCEALGLGKVYTPKTLGFEGPEAEQLAGSGFVYLTGYGKVPCGRGFSFKPSLVEVRILSQAVYTPICGHKRILSES